VRKVPDFDDLVGRDVPDDERARLRRAHDLLVQAGPPPELSPELEAVPWPDEALGPLWARKRKPVARRPLVLAAALTTAIVAGFLLGQATTSSTTSIDARQTLALRGTELARNAQGTLELGKRDRHGNWPMVLHVKNLPKLAEGGYYDLYLTRGGKPLVLCGTFNVDGETVVRFTAAYDLEHFDKNGWVVTRQPAGHHEPTQIVLRPAV
jgi:anti-sigma-K factor RskA